MTNRKVEYWVIPCMDEQPVQLQRETRIPRPATRQHGQRVDYAARG